MRVIARFLILFLTLCPAYAAFDVRVAGAKGDGVTDDGPSIQLAIDMLSKRGGTLFIPPGEYFVSERSQVGIRLRSNVNIDGDGATIIAEPGQVIHVIAGTDIENVSVSGLTIDGNGQEAGHGIRLENVEDVTLEDLSIKNTHGYGIGIEGGTNNRIWIDQIRLDEIGNDGIDFKNTGDGNSAIFISRIIIGTFDLRGVGGKAGIDVRGAAHISDIYISDIPNHGSGVRFRQDSESTGTGGSRSTLRGFQVYGSDQFGGSGVVAIGDDISISDGSMSDVYIGLHLAGRRISVSGVNTDSCMSDGFRLSGHDIVITSSHFMNGEKRGGRIEGDGNRLIGVISRGNQSWDLQITPSAEKTTVIGSDFPQVLDEGQTTQVQ